MTFQAITEPESDASASASLGL